MNTNWLPSVLPVLVMVATAYSTQIQQYLAQNPTPAAVLGCLYAILTHLLPSPIKDPKDQPPSAAIKATGILLCLLLLPGMASAQSRGFVLPFRANHEQRLLKLEQQLQNQINQLQQQAHPQQLPPIIINQPAPQPQFNPQYPPLQNIPLGGPPLQNIPLGGPPRQDIPLGGPPIQNIPIGTLPQQNIPLGQGPQQIIPLVPPSQSSPVPAPTPQQPQPVPVPQMPKAEPAPTPQASPAPTPQGSPLQSIPLGVPPASANGPPAGYQKFSGWRPALWPAAR